MTAITIDYADHDDGRPAALTERLFALTHVEVPAAAAAVRRAYQAWQDAVAFKDGLTDEIREIAGLLDDDTAGVPAGGSWAS